MEKRQSRLGLIGKLIMVSIISVLLSALILVTMSTVNLNKTYNKLVMEELKATDEHLDSAISSLNDNSDWSMEGDELLKGGEPITEEIGGIIENLQKETGIDYTIFWGDTRVLTTINKSDGSGKLVGTKASDAVITNTLKGGNDFSASDLNIEGQKYMGYYIPLKNSDGSTVGMCFTGRPSADVSADIIRANIILIIAVIVILILVIAVGVILNKKISAQMHDVSDSLVTLVSGNLNTTIDVKVLERNDEIGLLGRSTISLIEKIQEIIGQTKNIASSLSEQGNELARSSGNASGAASQVAGAVDDISKGAVSQAENIQTAVTETETIGNGVSLITNNVTNLNSASDKMQNSYDATITALNALIEQSNKVSTSVESISETIERTDKSAKAIAEFTDAINAIATQTNLLSLNASIEAARAGDAGKGFAVVASEISNLASQSKESADKINGIVSELQKDASESVDVMQVLSKNFGEQGSQLDATKESMDEMALGINDVVASAAEIAVKVDDLENAKNSLNSVIDDLSAISEENAASTQETNASMEELTATFSIINENAEELKVLANNLTDTIGYFK